MVALDIYVIIGYFIVLLGVGFYMGRKIKTSEDYMVAGRSLGFPVLLGTLIGSAIGAAATFGKAGKAYEVGYAIFIASLAYMLGYIAMCFLAPKLQKAQLDTIPATLEQRYGKSMRIVAAIVLVLAVVALFGAQLIAIGLTAETVFADYHLNFGNAVIIASIIILIYTWVGGLMAVAYNDLIQTCIMLIGGGLLLPYYLYQSLGDGAVEALSFQTESFLGGMHWAYVLSFFPIYFAFALIDPTIWQRIAAAKNNKIVGPALIGTSITYALWSVIVIAFGVIAHNILPDLTNGDNVIPILVMNYMPPLAKGFCLAAIMGIIISTADSALLVTGTTVSTDVFKVLQPNISDKKLLLINRMTILIVVCFGLIFALRKSNIFDVMMLALAIFVAGLFVPVMAALFYDYATKQAALVSAIVGAVTLLAVHALKAQQLAPTWIEPIVAALFLSGISMWIISKLTYNEDTKTTPLLN